MKGIKNKLTLKKITISDLSKNEMNSLQGGDTWKDPYHFTSIANHNCPDWNSVMLISCNTGVVYPTQH